MLQSDMAATGFKCNARTRQERSSLPYSNPYSEQLQQIFTFSDFSSVCMMPDQLHYESDKGSVASRTRSLYIRRSEYRSPNPYQQDPKILYMSRIALNTAYTFKHRSDFPLTVAIQSPPCRWVPKTEKAGIGGDQARLISSPGTV